MQAYYLKIGLGHFLDTSPIRYSLLVLLLSTICVAGCGLVNGFIDHLHTQLGTTTNYSAIANPHNSQITTGPAKLSSSLLYLHQPFPGNGFLTGEILQLHALRDSLHDLLCRTQ
jgi:hypothetical protein